MIAFVLSAVGIFRLVRQMLSKAPQPETAARVGAWIAALVFVANPNFIYLQTTAMTEPLCVAFFVWSLVYFGQFVRTGSEKALSKSGLCVLGASLTRYDGWFLSGVLCLVGLLVILAGRRKSNRALIRFVLLALAGPLLWLGYNWIVYKNPLEFANGPYSAKAIEARSAQTGAMNPAEHSIPVATVYVLKTARMTLAEGHWEKLWWVFAVCGLIAIAAERRLWPLLLLWIPLPFYVLSLAYGDVPIYLPVWWPFSYYNVRFGVELLPAFAAFAGLSSYLVTSVWSKPYSRTAVSIIVLVLVSISYFTVWRAKPLTYREASINSKGRIALERDLARVLQSVPDTATLLMYLGDHVGALQRAGIPLSHVINEGNHRPWKRPSDAQGLWERALADPAKYADFVVAFAGDPVANAMAGKGLRSLLVIHTTGQAEVTIYQARAER
jgi:4-amino-4-deoxy-L-arabinose transferase-like glycosyltransferase